MSDYSWLTPHVNVATAVVTAAAAAYTAFNGLVLAPRGYRRLVAARRVGDHRVVRRRYRTAWMVQSARCVLVLSVVALDGGLSRADVGLVLPRGRHLKSEWGWFAYGCVVVLLAGLVLRRRALTGRRVPGQRMFAALVARDGERVQAAAVAFGAGVSEELLFRGLFVAVAVDRLGLAPVPALILVSVGFGAVHLYQGWLGVLGTAVIGLLFGAFFLQTQSLLMPIILHVLIDLRGLVLVPVAVGPPAAPRRADNPPPQPQLARADRPLPQGDDGPPRLP